MGQLSRDTLPHLVWSPISHRGSPWAEPFNLHESTLPSDTLESPGLTPACGFRLAHTTAFAPWTPARESRIESAKTGQGVYENRTSRNWTEPQQDFVQVQVQVQHPSRTPARAVNQAQPQDAGMQALLPRQGTAPHPVVS